jgi:type IV secretion system protein VirB5
MSKSSEKLDNPYFAARQEWDDRYGSYIARARTWQVVAVVSIAIAGVSVVINGWQAAQSKVVPFIVEVDKLGVAHAYQVAEKTNLGDERIVKAQLVAFLVDWRSISSDAVLQRHRIQNAYKYLLGGSPAGTMLDRMYQESNPIDKAKEVNTNVQLTNILQSSPTSYQLEWTEIVRDARSGEVAFTQDYKGIFECVNGKPSTDIAEIIKNPSGVYIKNISFSKVI